MKTYFQILIFSLLALLPLLTTAQVGLQQDVRMNVSVGSFTAGGIGDYTGPVGVVGSTGYTVSNVLAGDYLIDDLNVYRIDSVIIIVAGSTATLHISYLQGTVGSQVPPQTGRGYIIRPTETLGLLLGVATGSNTITTEQLAKLITHNALVTDSYLSTVGGGLERYSAGAGVSVTASGSGITATKSAGQVTVTVPNGVVISSLRFVGASGDLNSGEITITINGGSGSLNTSDANSFWPALTVQNRTVVLPSDPFQQRPDDAGDSINIFNERWAVAGRVTVKITGLSGDFGIFGQF